MCTQNVDPINETPKEKYLDRYGREVGDFIKKIVTGDESWVHHYDPESKAQSGPPELCGRKIPHNPA